MRPGAGQSSPGQQLSFAKVRLRWALASHVSVVSVECVSFSASGRGVLVKKLKKMLCIRSRRGLANALGQRLGLLVWFAGLMWIADLGVDFLADCARPSGAERHNA